MKYRCHAVFVTLTYREDYRYYDSKLIYPYHTDNLPDPPQQCVPRLIDRCTGEIYRTVYKKHIQDALKRFREYRKKKGLFRSFSYFITSEYGPRTLRPHYHCIFFGLKREELIPFLHDWSFRFGFYQAKKIQYGNKSQFTVAGYVAKYCSKGMFENPLVSQKKVFKTFHLISKKIGYNYVTTHSRYHLCNLNGSRLYNRNNISAIVDRMYYKYVPDKPSVSGIIEFHYALPKYYKEYIYGTKNLLRYRMYQEICRRNDELYSLQLSIIQSERNCSDVQAIYFLDLQKIRESRFKEKQIYERLAKQYDKSKI